MKRNIYKLDDICLIISWIVLVILIIRSLILLPDLLMNLVTEDRDLSRPALFLGILLGSFIFLQMVGRSVRKKERRLQMIIEIILKRRNISAANLSRMTGISAYTLENDLVEIEKHSKPHIVFEDGRIFLRAGESVQVSYICPSCGAASSGDIYINSPLLQCDYCGIPLEDDEVRSLRNKLLQRAENTSKAVKKTEPLNIPLLIILFMFFWPGAIIYLVKYSMNRNKDTLLFDEVRKSFDLSYNDPAKESSFSVVTTQAK